METSALKNLGLTGTEIKVFLALLELENATAGSIIESSGLQNAVVHRAINSLKDKEFVTYIFEGKRKHYQTIAPRKLLDYMEEKKSELKKIIPELEAKSRLAGKKPKASMFQGMKGVRELINSIIEGNAKEYFSYGGSKKSNEALGDYFWEGFHRRRIEKKIKAKLLFHLSLKKWGKQLKKLKNTEIRYTEQEFEELTETIICGSKVGIILYLEKPYGFVIEEQGAAASYKRFFSLLWQQCNKFSNIK